MGTRIRRTALLCVAFVAAITAAEPVAPQTSTTVPQGTVEDPNQKTAIGNFRSL